MTHVYWMLELEVRGGQKENFERLMKDLVAAAYEKEPGTLEYRWSIDSEAKTCHVYERFADSAAALTHLEGLGDFAVRFMEAVAPRRFTIYGLPSEELKVALTAFSPTYMESAAGFVR